MRNERKQHEERRSAQQPEDARPPNEAIEGHGYIVAIGGSAGGLEAFEHFFAGIPPNTGMAFVVIQHLDPNHKALMPELLQRSIAMPVREIEDGMMVEPNHVYVIPPNTELSIADGNLHLSKPSEPHGLRLPIDTFFKSLAADAGDKSIAVIVSGMGTDGTLGLKAIKEVGGVVMVESPDSAKFDGMPKSAISTGHVDCIALIDHLPKELIAYVTHVPILHDEISEIDRHPPGALQKILRLLSARTGHDFFLYKTSTLYRRITKRAGLHQIDGISEYARYVEDNPDELDALFREFLIGVTKFFRDPAAFEYLEDRIIPDLVKRMAEGSSIRVWVTACSTGEEAYSIAIILRECVVKLRPESDLKIQVFATDIDERAIETARKGLYPANIAADITPERLERFFTLVDTGYLVKKVIRETVVFAPHDLTADPPFTKMDLVSCRNLLIYFSPELQKKVLPLFHYALNPDGILFLGTAEGIGSFEELFSTIDNKRKVFSRKETVAPRNRLIEIPFRAPFVETPKLESPTAKAIVDVQTALRQTLLERYAPPSVVVTPGGDIVLVSGKTGKYLEPAEGMANWNVSAMAREGLRLELPSAIHRASTHKTEVVLQGLDVKTNGDYQKINVTVSPLSQPDSANGLLLVVFEEAELPEVADTGACPTAEQDARSAEMGKELAYTKERLQTTLEEMESTQEELKSANEELQSTNEEVQSTNEELTTSKEELQSLNEELVTLNTELQSHVDDLTVLNNDMVNLFNSAQVATIFLDNELRIKRFTPAVVGTFNLRSIDVGRPITDITQNLNYETIDPDVRKVLDTLVTLERQVESTDDRWFIMRIMPYRTLSNVVDGVVITFSEITQLKQLEWALRESEGRFKTLVDSMDDFVFTLDCEQRKMTVFGDWLSKRDLKPEDFIGKSAMKSLGPEQIASRLEAVNKACAGETVRYEWSVPSNESIMQIQTSLSPILDGEGNITGVVGVGRDVTHHRRAETLGKALNDIHTEISSASGTEQVMHSIVVIASEALGVEFGDIALHEDGQWVVKYVSGAQKLRPGTRLKNEDMPYLNLVKQTTKPIVISDTWGDDRVAHDLAKEYDIRAILGIPLLAGKELLGVLSLISTTRPVNFTDTDIDFAHKLGLAVSLALINSRLIEAEHQAKLDAEVARQLLVEDHGMLQRALLPGEPHVTSGYQLATKFIPGAAGKQVGGDFYDVFETEDGRTAILIGDVSGKGVEAAAMAAATRSTVRAFAYDLGDPAQALTHTNAVISQSPLSERFATAFLAVIDSDTGRFSYSTAGHPPPMIRRAGGIVDILSGGEGPIGVEDGTQYRVFESSLAVGDQLVMYTDGISEARTRSRMLDIEGIKNALEQCLNYSPDETLDALFEAADDFSEGPLADDAAVVIIERNKQKI